MTTKWITVKTKKEFEELKMEYRNNGYNFITFTSTLVELEPMDRSEIVTIERKRK